MYTDALQGVIMFVGMLILVIFTYSSFGGVTSAHHQLTELNKLPSLFGKIGFQGFTAMPKFGWGSPDNDLWWIVITTLVMGVGIGVLAQPQLAVRFMTVKSKRELNRGVFSGGVFILCMTGVAFMVGALTNVYFYKKEVVTGKLISTTEKTAVIVKQERDLVVKIPCKLIHIDTDRDGTADVDLVAQGYDVEKDGKVIPFSKLMPTAEITQNADGTVTVKPKAISFLR
jgi:SSS family solute:Na+ symporter